MNTEVLQRSFIVPNGQIICMLYKLLATQYGKQILYAICAITQVTA